MIPFIRATCQCDASGRIFALVPAWHENGGVPAGGDWRTSREEQDMSSEVKSFLPTQAWEFSQSNQRVVMIDVRSSMEFLFVGHPQGSIHVPWIDAPDWTVNANFVTEVRKVMLGGIGTGVHGDDAPVILICRSGKRSLEAGKLLVENGFKEVYNIEEGFEGELDESHHRSTKGGWRYHGLPWEQC
jgi:rhodanese-related sulfurtransferase